MEFITIKDQFELQQHIIKDFCEMEKQALTLQKILKKHTTESCESFGEDLFKHILALVMKTDYLLEQLSEKKYDLPVKRFIVPSDSIYKNQFNTECYFLTTRLLKIRSTLNDFYMLLEIDFDHLSLKPIKLTVEQALERMKEKNVLILEVIKSLFNIFE